MRAMGSFEHDVAETRRWFHSPRFAGVKRLHSARDVVEQRGTLSADYTVAREAAEGFYARLRELFAEKKCITTFGAYSPGQAVAMKRAGIEAIYVGGWTTSAKGAPHEDPGPPLASYPLSQVPDDAAPIVRALLVADKNQAYARARLSDEQRRATPPVDYRPFIIADADAGHGGDAHVRNVIRRFVEVGVPGYHLEDRKSGTKRSVACGGNVLVAEDEQIRRLSAARFQLDVMRVPGVVVARTDAESATLLDGRSDERDQPFILGATHVEVPSYRAVFLATLRRFHRRGIEELGGHELYAMTDGELAAADVWIDGAGLSGLFDEALVAHAHDHDATRGAVDAALERVFDQLVDVWQVEAGVKTFGEAVAEEMRFLAGEGVQFPMSEAEWLAFAKGACFYTISEKAREMGVHPMWDCEHAKTPDGHYQVRGGIDYAIAKSLAAAPFADIVWMETKNASLHDAEAFAGAIHEKFPEKMLAYNLSPSFDWDATGMSDDELRRFADELGKMGFVFTFITYGGHQIDGLAGEEFSGALREDGVLAVARVQRKFRLLESPYRTPLALVGGPRADAALKALSGHAAITSATSRTMGRPSAQLLHVIASEVPPKLLEEWLEQWCGACGVPGRLRVSLKPLNAGAELLELVVRTAEGTKAANVVFTTIHDRHGHSILSIRDQNTFEGELRRKRLMTLVQLFLIHRYKADSLHYLTPTDDNQRQTEGMRGRGIFSTVKNEVGDIIVAEVNKEHVRALLAPDRATLNELIAAHGAGEGREGKQVALTSR
jgi:isocitrate lyase